MLYHSLAVQEEQSKNSIDLGLSHREEGFEGEAIKSLPRRASSTDQTLQNWSTYSMCTPKSDQEMTDSFPVPGKLANGARLCFYQVPDSLFCCFCFAMSIALISKTSFDHAEETRLCWVSSCRGITSSGTTQDTFCGCVCVSRNASGLVDCISVQVFNHQGIKVITFVPGHI
ncbi:hypothetical protein AVEN_63752-1 [Araneus ventricosus]|uniref:Uncharacterized protein n=1 Tax=Araneus ventricosus TaxID=182803 RepID=A0A4Y2TVF4_ARAVE|nr:hypothetical protein AVEN_63752-1 [Araneus ventricosus]